MEDPQGANGAVGAVPGGLQGHRDESANSRSGEHDVTLAKDRSEAAFDLFWARVWMESKSHSCEEKDEHPHGVKLETLTPISFLPRLRNTTAISTMRLST